MERRNRSLKALNRLVYIDSLDDEIRAKSLALWVEDYLDNNFLDNLELTISEMKILLELFYKNISFLKKFHNKLKQNITDSNKIKKFLQ